MADLTVSMPFRAFCSFLHDDTVPEISSATRTRLNALPGILFFSTKRNEGPYNVQVQSFVDLDYDLTHFL